MTRPFVVSALLLIVGCATSPNQELKTARDDRAADFTKNVRAQHELAERQHAEDAMLANKHAAERRQTRDATMGMLIADNERVRNASAAVTRERHAFDAEVIERMAKIDSRADRLGEETNRAPQHVRAKVAPLWQAFDESRVETRRQLNRLWTHSNSAYPEAKADVNARVDSLDGTLDAIASKIER